MGEVFDRYYDTAGNYHWSDTETGKHIISNTYTTSSGTKSIPFEEYSKWGKFETGEESKPEGGMVGWICPVCGRGLSPFTYVCPCKAWPKMEVTC